MFRRNMATRGHWARRARRWRPHVRRISQRRPWRWRPHSAHDLRHGVAAKEVEFNSTPFFWQRVSTLTGYPLCVVATPASVRVTTCCGPPTPQPGQASTVNVNVQEEEPHAFVAVMVTDELPGEATVPVKKPVEVLSVTPAGSPLADHVAPARLLPVLLPQVPKRPA